jgi:hypothetical protein
MPFIILLIVISICVFYFIFIKRKHPTHKFFEITDSLLADKRVTNDLAPTIEKLIYLVDQRESLEYEQSHTKLVNLFEIARQSKCYASMEYEIKKLFKVTNKILGSKIQRHITRY